MTVQQLIDRLSRLHPDTEIRLMVGQHWPFEHAVKGVCTRHDLPGHDSDIPDDAFIVVGAQLGYGDEDAWKVCR